MLSVEKSLIADPTHAVGVPKGVAGVAPTSVTATVTSTPWETSPLGVAGLTPALSSTSTGLVQPQSHTVTQNEKTSHSHSDTEVASGTDSSSQQTVYPQTVSTTGVDGSVGQSLSAGSNESSPTQPKLEPKDDTLKQEEHSASSAVPHSSIYQVITNRSSLLSFSDFSLNILFSCF